jgi:hypothetical protein
MMNKDWLVIALLGATATAVAADKSEPYCYEVRVNGRDRSFFQYVDSSWVRFADAMWKRNPQVLQIRLTDDSGKSAAEPMVIPANPNPQHQWGGVQFRHLPFGKVLTLKADQSTVSFRRQKQAGSDCPQMNFVLEGRWNGYDVLQHVPLGTRKPLLGSSIHPLAGKIVMSVGLPNLLEAHAVLIPGEKANSEVPFTIEKLAAAQLLKKYPDLQTQVTKEWGVNASYLMFEPLKPKDTIKVTVKLASGREASFFVRRLPEES